ncbi:DUF5320 domain-containing protein [Coprothermobacteraceae bacterium]|nr:DUF5320 domain-containing protein [Coprothermobacteraceae bacterium]
MRGRWMNAEWNQHAGLGRWNRREWAHGTGNGFRGRLGIGFGAGPWCAYRGWASQDRLAYLKEVERALERRLDAVKKLIEDLEGSFRIQPEH